MTSRPPHHLGPYTLIEELGATRDGTCYRGLRRETGGEAQLRFMHAFPRDRVGFVLGELRAWQRVSSPALAPILEFGLEDGVPWFAIPLVEGQPLLSFGAGLEPARREGGSQPPLGLGEDVTVNLDMRHSDAWTDDLTTTAILVPHPTDSQDEEPLPPAALVPAVARVLGLAQKLAVGLGSLHDAGLTQALLRPEGVVVKEDGQPVIVDLGVGISARWESAAGLSIGALGAFPYVPYLAPELVRGGPLHGRADLYSLGCILYHLLAGRPPYSGSPADIVRSLRRHWPARLRDRVQGVPPAVDALVSRLLARGPWDRPAGARELAEQIRHLGVDAVPEPWPGARLRLPALEARLTGREDEKVRLQRHGGVLGEGRGGVVAVVGPPGSGRSRLLHEMARRVLRRGLKAVVASAGGGSASPLLPTAPLAPLSPLLQATARWARVAGAARAAATLGPCGPILGPFEPGLRGIGGESVCLDPLGDPPPDARARLYHFLLRALEALCAPEGMALLIDDVHLADELTLGFLGYLTQGTILDDLPVWVVLTVDVEAAAPPSLSALLERPRVERVALAPLDDDALAVMAEDLIPGATEALLAQLTAGCGGAPAALDDRISLLAQREALWVEEGRCCLDPQLDRELDRLGADPTLARLKALDPRARELAELISVSGTLEWRRATSLWPHGDQALQDAAFTLLKTRLLAPGFAPRLRLARASVATAIYESLSPPRRAELHRRLAARLRTTAGAGLERRLAVAAHREAAGDATVARSRWLAAARAAATAGAFDLAAELFARLSRSGAEPGLAALERVGTALVPAGRLAEAAQALDAILDMDAGAPAALVLRGRVALLQGECEAAASWLVAGMSALGLGASVQEQLEARFLLAEARVRTGEPAEAMGLLREAMGLADALPPRWMARVRSQLGLIYLEQGRFHEALALQQAALQGLDEDETPLLYAGVLRREAHALTALGNLADVRLTLGAALAIYHHWGEPHSEAACRVDLASACRQLGRLEVARNQLHAAIKLFRALEDGPAEVAALDALGEVFWEADRLPSAEEAWDSASDALQAMGDLSAAAWIVLNQARAQRMQLHARDARGLVAEARRLSRAAGDPTGEVGCRCEEIHLRLWAGEGVEAEIVALRSMAAPLPAVGRHRLWLARAEEAARSASRGLSLLCGEAPTTLPARVARRLKSQLG